MKTSKSMEIQLSAPRALMLKGLVSLSLAAVGRGLIQPWTSELLRNIQSDEAIKIAH